MAKGDKKSSKKDKQAEAEAAAAELAAQETEVEEESMETTTATAAVDADATEEADTTATRAAAPSATSPVVTESGILPLFWDLASLEDKQRSRAAAKLLKVLAAAQEKHKETIGNWDEASAGPFGSEADVFALCAGEVTYSLKRLVRGLPSSREGARQGFSLALTELLALVDFIPASIVFGWVQQHSEVTGGMSGSEERDMLFGKIFGIIAIQRSGKFKLASADKDTHWAAINALLDVSYRKSYLQEMAAEGVNMLVTSLKSHDYAQDVLQDIFAYYQDKDDTCHKLAVLIHIQQEFDNIDITSAAPKWGSSNVLDLKTLTQLAAALRESTTSNPRVHIIWKYIVKYYAAPAAAPVPAAAVDAPTAGKKKSKKKAAAEAEEKGPAIPFDQFWRVAVDENLFMSTLERKYLAFCLVHIFGDKIPVDQVQFLVGKNFIQLMINYLHQFDKYISKVVRRALDTIIARAKQSPSLAVYLVSILSGPQGSMEFDNKTRTKTIQHLIGLMDKDSFLANFNKLRDVVLGDDSVKLTPAEVEAIENSKADDEDDEDGGAPAATASGVEANKLSFADRKRQWALDSMLGLVRNPFVKRDASWIRPFLSFLIRHGHFQRKEKITDKKFNDSITKHKIDEAVANEMKAEPFKPLSAQITKVIQQRLTGALRELWTVRKSKAQGPDEKENKAGKDTPKKEEVAPKAPHKSSSDESSDEAVQWFREAVNIIHTIESSGVMVITYGGKPEDSELRLELYGFITKIQEKMDNHAEGDDVAKLGQLRAFRLFLASCYLQLISDDISATATAKDAISCCKRLVFDEQVEGDKIDPVSVLIDLLLSYLGQPQNILRRVAEHVFRAFSTQLTPRSAKLLFDVLTTRTTPVHAAKILKVYGGDGDEDDDDGMQIDGPALDDEDDEDDDDVDEEEEEEDAEEEDEDEEAKNDDEDEDEDEDDNEEDEDEDEDDDGEVSDAEYDGNNQEVDEVFRSKVLDVLKRQGMAATDNDEINENGEDGDEKEGPKEDEDDDDEAEEEVDADENAMSNLDNQLANVFKVRKLQKQRKAAALKSMYEMKNKVLDFLEIYVRRNQVTYISIQMLHALCTTVKHATKTKPDQQIVRRISALIKTIGKSKLLCTIDSIGVSKVSKQFDLLHAQLLKQQGKTGAEIYMSAIHPIIRLANTNLDGAAELTDAQNQVLEHVKSSFQGDIVKFMEEKHNNIEPTVLVNYIDRYRGWCHAYVQPLCDKLISGEIRSFQITMACALLSKVLSVNVGHELPIMHAVSVFLSGIPLHKGEKEVLYTLRAQQLKDTIHLGGKALARIQFVKTPEVLEAKKEFLEALRHAEGHALFHSAHSVRSQGVQFLKMLGEDPRAPKDVPGLLTPQPKNATKRAASEATEDGDEAAEPGHESKKAKKELKAALKLEKKQKARSLKHQEVEKRRNEKKQGQVGK